MTNETILRSALHEAFDFIVQLNRTGVSGVATLIDRNGERLEDRIADALDRASRPLVY